MNGVGLSCLGREPVDRTPAWFMRGEMLAQLESHFWFNLAQGHLGPASPVFRENFGCGAINWGVAAELDYRTLREYVRAHGVGTLVIADDLAARWQLVAGRATSVGTVEGRMKF